MPTTRLPLALLILVSLYGCAAPVKVGDGRIEPSLAGMTGLPEDAAKTAATQEALSLWDTYALAVERTERLALKAEDMEQAGAKTLQSAGKMLPHLSLQGSKTFTSDGTLPSGGSTNPSASLSLNATQTLFTGLDEVAGISASSANADFHRASSRHEAGRLLLDVSRVFYSVLQLEESLKTKEASRELTERILAQLKNWQAVGRTRNSEVLSTQAQLSRLSAETRETQNQLTQAREELAGLTGVPVDQKFADQSSAAAPSSDLTLLEKKVEVRADVLAAKASVGLADALLLQAHGRNLPSLSAQGNYFLHREGSSVPEWNVLLTANLPFLEGGETLGVEKEMASRKRQAEMALGEARRLGLQEVRQAYQSLVNSIGEAEAYQKALEASEAEYKAVSADYRNSLTTNLEVLRTLNSLQDVKDNYSRARFRALTDQVWLGVATGDLPKR